MEFQLNNSEIVILNPTRSIDSEDSTNTFELRDIDSKIWIKIKQIGSNYMILFKDERINDDFLDEKLDRLLIEFIETEQSGTEANETKLEEIFDPFNPEDIKVHAKQFSLTLIMEMIDDGDIDLSPNFQRNLVWNNFQKSRLIESILLRIPLPMFYFSEDKEGKITIVDGLQRLTTIKEFMDNKFPLRKLEYLSDSCDGRFYETEGKKVGIDAKYKRWFKQTQFSVNVIDPFSPYKVKYDIFRRINTGGKPLNNQEIRNCLANNSLREVIKSMVSLDEFKTATDFSIKPTRMEDQEVALRFILFYKYKTKHGNIEEYNGYINQSLDDLTEELSVSTEVNIEDYVKYFSNAMRNAEYLFGCKYSFRKVRPNDLLPNAYKQLINKALFVCWSILLADYDHSLIKKKNNPRQLLKPLADRIAEDVQLLNFLSYGTNGRSNLLYTFEVCQNLIREHLNV